MNSVLSTVAALTAEFDCIDMTQSSMGSDSAASLQVQLDIWPDSEVVLPLRNIVTRWISHFNPMRRTWRLYPAVLLHAYRLAGEAQASSTEIGHYHILRDVYQLLCLAAMLPMITVLQGVIKVLQRRDMYILDFADAVQRVQTKVKQLYLDDDAFSGALFSQLASLAAVLSKKSKKRKTSPLLFKLADGERKGKETLHYRVRMDDGRKTDVQLLARPVPTGKAGRPSTLPRPVGVENFRKQLTLVKVSPAKTALMACHVLLSLELDVPMAMQHEQ